MTTSPLPDDVLSIPHFAGLSAAQRQALAADAERVIVPAQTLLIAEGQTATSVDLILRGQVRLFLDQDTITLDLLGPRAVLGDCALCEERPHPVAAETVSETELLRFSPEAIWTAILAEDTAIFGLLSSITVRLKRLLSQVNDIKLRTTTQRLAMFLVIAARHHASTHPSFRPHANSGPVLVPLPYERRLLAARLGMTPESLSRSMSRLAEHGVSNQSRSVIAISNLSALAALAELDAIDEDFG